VSEEPLQRGGGGAEWRDLGSADSRKKKEKRKKRVKFLIQTEILGLSVLRSVIGAAFIHTRNSHLYQSLSLEAQPKKVNF
jgi:hypothetical protein